MSKIKRMCEFLSMIVISGVLYSGCLTPAQAQGNPTCPTRPVGDNSNACASTAFVQQNGGNSVIDVTRPPFNAKCDASTDDTAAIQAAVNAVPVGGQLLIPKANCVVSSTITVTTPMVINCGNANGNIGGSITINANTVSPLAINSNWVTIRSCYINGTGTPSGNEGIRVGTDGKLIADGTCTNGSTTFTSATQANFTAADIGKRLNATGCGTGGVPLFTSITGFTNSTTVTLGNAASCGGGCPGAGSVSARYGFVYTKFYLIDSFIVDFAKGLHFINAAEWGVENLFAINNISVHIEDQTGPDFGHGFISNSYLQSVDTAVGHYPILWNSGGETLISNTKLQNGQYGVFHASNVGLTGGFTFTGGGMEGCGTSALFFSEAAQFNNVQVSNAYIVCGTTPVVVDNTSGSIVNKMTFTGNTVTSAGGTVGLDIGKCNDCTFAGNNINASGNGIIFRNNCSPCDGMNNKIVSSLTYSNASASSSINDSQGMGAASLPSVAANGSRIFVTDGVFGTSPCGGGGTGAWAERIAGAWVCSRPLTVINAAARVGGFDIWQRIVAPAVGQTLAQAASLTAYQNDGWYLITGANQASTLTQSAGIVNGSLYAAKVQRNSGQTGTGVMRYAAPLDSDEIAILQGSFVALSFSIKEGANQSFSHTVNYNVYCGTGSPAKRGGTPYTGETTVINGGVATTTTAARTIFTSSAIVPTNCTQMEIQFSWTPSGTAGVDDSFTVDNLQLEPVLLASSPANPYLAIDYQTQLAKAQRFLPAWTSLGSNNVQIIAFGGSYTTNAGFVFWPFPVPTRVRPTGIVISAVSDFSMDTGSAAASVLTALGVSASGTSLYGATLTMTPTGTPLTIGQWTVLQNTAVTTAQFYLTGAEI